MTASIELPTGYQHPAVPALLGYLRDVTAELGIGLESCTLDHDRPVSAYVALDTRLPHYPDRDVALLWDEERGWAAAIETHSGEDLIVLRYLGGPTVVPPPRRVARFVTALHEDDHTVGRPDPVELRTAGDAGELAALLRRPAAAR
ncbi:MULTISPECIES: DUF6292 family protein [unclassified Amycolatopsis]|uniref:DUF6292 family protein n=1 Tax=unclassified Amycolatopsis TaxID=2618356 RepID=UPI002876F9C4|nr:MULTISPECIES: DUF6292 family protein [unclassified Amycolatopsis]MDS0136847.1 hypothetical protein [Amycolatopsis sp. 505]MDS0143512.1 hypothetical protein [Amycolatopsis sp. CM201R]